MFKNMSNKKICTLVIVGGLVLIGLAVIGYVNISKLGLTPAEYDSSRDMYINIMFGGGRATSNNGLIDMLMDSRETYLWSGILLAAVGCIGLYYYTKHPEKDKSIPAKEKPQEMQNLSPTIVSAVQKATSGTPQKVISWQQRSGIAKGALILSCAATLCFILGIGILPYSLLSIAAGAMLVYALLKRNNVKTFLPILPIFLFMARFLFSETSYSGYDWITVLYRVLGYGVLAIIVVMNLNGFSLIIFEDDDIRLLSNVMAFALLANAVLSGIEFFRGTALGYNIIMFRLGSIFFWLSLACFYIYAEKPQIPTKNDWYQGRQSHPYHTLGGSILLFMVIIYAIAIACFIGGPLLIEYYKNKLISIARTGGAAGYVAANLIMRISFIGMIIAAGIMIIAGLFLLWLNRKLRLRSPLFLLYYEYALFAALLMSIIVIFAGNPWIGILLVIIFTIVSFTTIKWLTTSIRVRTYMGSDEYMRMALFTRKIPSPTPADRPAAQGQQHFTQYASDEEEWEEVPSVSSSNEEWEMVDEPAAYIPPQQRVYVRPDCCCICGNSLVEGHAVLFTFMSGDEARIDRSCHEQLSMLMDYRNPRAQAAASAYLRSRLDLVDPSVANYLNVYLQQSTGYGY